MCYLLLNLSLLSVKAVAKTFNVFFVNIVPNLGIDAYIVSEVITSHATSLKSIIEKYKHHPSITAIKIDVDKIEKDNFSFKEIIKPFLFKGIKNLKPKKMSQSNDVPTKLIKEYSDIFTTIIILKILASPSMMVPFQKALNV